jgi:2-polyprenyl-3-methyl-5-hydroxy-6-metoxy-1,4-benzoquinol methylase
MSQNAVLQAAYDQWHAQLEADEDASSPWHELIRQRLDPARDLAGKRALEIGCGRGGFACWLAGLPNGPSEVVGMDFSPKALEKARAAAERRGLGRVVWREGDIQNIDAPEASFDTVFSCETIEHVPDPRRALAELRRVLRPGGRLFLTTPNYLGTMGLYRGYLRCRGRRFTEAGQPYNNFMLLPMTVAWVRRAGLAVRHVDGVGHYLPFPGRPALRLRALDRCRWLTRWFALHSLVVAEKP